MYEEAIKELEKLPFRAKELLFENSNRLNKDILDIIAINCSYCESPIEKILIAMLTIETDNTLWYDVQSLEQCGDKKYSRCWLEY